MDEIIQLINTFCHNNKLHKVKELLTICPTIPLEKVYQNALSSGHIQCCQYLLELNPNLTIENHHSVLLALCKSGNYKMVQFIHDHHPSISIHENNDEIFRYACVYSGNDTLVSYLLTTYPNIDIHACGEDAFRGSCKYGHLKVVQYLLTTYPTINSSIYNDGAFRCAVNFNQHSVVSFLASKNPYYQELLTNNDRLNTFKNHELYLGDANPAQINGVEECNGIEEECSICHTNKSNVVTQPCNHQFCYECLNTWYITSPKTYDKPCPYCRTPFNLCQKIGNWTMNY